MNQCLPQARAFVRNEDGEGVVEYALVAALFAFVIVASDTDTGIVLDNLFTLISAAAEYATPALSTATQLVLGLVSLARGAI